MRGKEKIVMKRIKIGTFNVKNLFERSHIMNSKVLKQLSERFEEINMTINFSFSQNGTSRFAQGIGSGKLKLTRAFR